MPKQNRNINYKIYIYRKAHCQNTIWHAFTGTLEKKIAVNIQKDDPSCPGTYRRQSQNEHPPSQFFPSTIIETTTTPLDPVHKYTLKYTFTGEGS